MTLAERRQRHRLEDDAARQWKGPYRSYDLVKELHDRGRRDARARGCADDPVLIARRGAEHDQGMVAHGSGRLRHDGRQRTGRDQHDCHVWAAVQPQQRRPAHVVHPPGEVVRGQPPDQHRRRSTCSGRSARCTGSRRCSAAISAYEHAPAKIQTAWTNAYTNALNKAKVTPSGGISVPAGNYGPVPTMMNSLLTYAQAGGLDGTLLTSKHSTRPTTPTRCCSWPTVAC